MLDLYRSGSRLTIRRLWMLVRYRLLRESPSGDLSIVAGSALAESVSGEFGDWTRADMFLAGFVGVDIPESRQTTEWKRSEQERIKAIRAERARVRTAVPGRS